MGYEIIKIVSVNGLEVAYLLDKQQGKVIKMLVEDRTGHGKDRPVDIVYEAPSVFALGQTKGQTRTTMNDSYVPYSDNPGTTGGMIPRGITEKNVVDVDFESKGPHPELPDKPIAVPPPGIASVFGGLAEEKRFA